jgi:hypothetical protein
LLPGLRISGQKPSPLADPQLGFSAAWNAATTNGLAGSRPIDPYGAADL